MEDKQGICDELFLTLKLTECDRDIIDLKYEVLEKTGSEIVTAEWPCGKKVINVTGDSGIALIKDIINAIS